MKLINLTDTNSVMNNFVAELRDPQYQQNRMLFRNNVIRIARIMAYEISKTLDYDHHDVTTPLGVAPMELCRKNVVLGSIFRAGLPFHQGFLDVFDHADNCFVSAYRKYRDESHTDVDICVEYLATPDLTDRTLILCDPMLATGGSFELAYKAVLSKVKPKRIILAALIAAPEGIEHLKQTMPEDTEVWCATIDDHLNANKYIIPGLGDCGDLCYGDKL